MGSFAEPEMNLCAEYCCCINSVRGVLIILEKVLYIPWCFLNKTIIIVLSSDTHSNPPALLVRLSCPVFIFILLNILSPTCLSSATFVRDAQYLRYPSQKGNAIQTVVSKSFVLKICLKRSKAPKILKKIL